MNRKEAKRKRREKRKQRAAARTAARIVLPRFVACYYRKDLTHPTEEVLQDAVECAMKRSEWIRLPYRAIMDDKQGQCWLNVEKAIARWGGRMVCGWFYRIDPLEGQHNCLADVEAIPHAVWADDTGNLFEVSRDCVGGLFFPSDKVQPLMALNVGFSDTEFLARTYRPSIPVPSSLFGNFYVRVRRHEGTLT